MSQIDGVLGSNTEPVIEYTVIPLDKSSCMTTIGSPDIGKNSGKSCVMSITNVSVPLT